MTIDRLLPGEGAWGILFSNILGAVAMVLNILLDTYFWIVIIAAALTWIRPDPYNPIVRVLRSLTEPVFLQGAQMAALYIRGGIDFFTRCGNCRHLADKRHCGQDFLADFAAKV